MKIAMTKKFNIGFIIALTAALFVLPGCKRAGQASFAASTGKNDPLAVQVTPQLLNTLSVGHPQWQEITTEQKAAARMQTDASRVARIGSPVEGRITRVVIFEGQKVHQGQVLAMLHSNSLSDTQFAFIKATSQQALSEQAAERARQLVQLDVIGKAELQKREAEVLQNVTEVASLRAQLQGLGMTENTIRKLETTRKLNSEYPIIASISGTVVERSVTVGQVVRPADQAFLIADLSNLWFVAEVPEEHAASLKVGKAVTATVPALPGQVINGHLSFVSPVVNPETRTVLARMDLPNPQGIYKPDMLASMTFENRPEKDLTIPSTAVVREENKDHVFVRKSARVFVLHPVELGVEVSDHRVVLHGLTADDTIVLDGAFHLNNQRKQEQMKGGD